MSQWFERHSVEAFLYREARLADESNYAEWISLWTEDGIYWVPTNEDDYDPARHLSIVYDDRARLQDRVDRLMTGKAWAQEPRSRLRRLISNVELGSPDDKGDLEVRSNFVLGEQRRGLLTTYFARQVHKLRPVPEGLQIAFKKVMLINNDEPIHNLSFLI